MSKYIQSEFLCEFYKFFIEIKTREIVEKEGKEEDNRKAWKQAKGVTATRKHEKTVVTELT